MLYKTHQNLLQKFGPVKYVALVIATVLTLSIFFQRIFLQTKISVSTKLLKDKTIELKHNARSNYEELAKQQAINSNIEDYSTNFVKRKAQGNHRLYLIFVKPETLQNSQVSDLVKKLSAKKSNSSSSLYYLKTYMEKAAKSYGANNFTIEPIVRSPITLSHLEQVGDIFYSWEKDNFSIVKLEDTFENLLIKNNIQINNDLVVFLYLDNSYENTSGSNYSFYENKKFRSFAMHEKGRSYVNIYSLAPEFASTVTEIVIHETLHFFGATDKYNEEMSIDYCTDKGHGVVNNIAPLDQNTADFMCMYIEEKPSKYRRAKLVDHNLVINRITAKEIGWLSKFTPF
jgi:hypothetical protein